MICPVYLYRASRWLYLHHVPKIPSILQRINYFLTGCDLPPAAAIGKRPLFQHWGAGVVINNHAVIGDDVMFMPHVVVGANRRAVFANDHKLNRSTPNTIKIQIGDRVMLGAGVKIIATGELIIGNDVTIGANAVVLKSLPDGAIAVGVPARILQDKKQ